MIAAFPRGGLLVMEEAEKGGQVPVLCPCPQISMELLNPGTSGKIRADTY
jgi:hypothetical protein